jgi:hypothetical protein
VLSLDHRPLHRERPRIESPADEHFAIHPNCASTPQPVVSPELAPKVRMIRLAHELEENLAGLRRSRRRGFRPGA